VTKLLLILLASTALAESVAPKEPPLLIDSQPSQPTLDANR
jgi:hypothetical protein